MPRHIFLTRCDSERHINKNEIHSRAINAVLMISVANKHIN